jgi:hypothetical protein
MRLRIFAFVFVVWLCFPRNASATLNSGCFAAHYSSYTSTSLGSDVASIIQTVQVSGYTEALNPAVWMGPQLGWQYPCTNQTNQMQSSTHTSNIRNLLGTTGGDYSQGPTPALNYNNYVVSITAPATPGATYTSETDGKVVCVIAGSIFEFPPIIYTVFLSLGNMKLSWHDADSCIYSVDCPLGTGPYCGEKTYLYVGGMHVDPPCDTTQYAHSYHLVVNYKCSLLGRVVRDNTTGKCY